MDVPAEPGVRGFLGHYLRDLIYGANDGIITTLAVVAGVTGANLAPVVAIVLGLANLLADGFSMGASNYLGIRSEADQAGHPVDHGGPLRHGSATFAAFVVAGGVPLVAFVAAPDLPVGAFTLAAGLSAVELAVIGGLRSPFTNRSTVASALEMLLVGGLAGVVAFLVGLGADQLIG